ncbi:MAG: hypothetical protein RLZZ214_1724 [Verrucomicrobiota bacterium]|jgi:two-component system response regulator
MNHKVILLVEDNPDDRDFTSVALPNNNIANEVVLAGDGEKALEFLLGEGPTSSAARSLLPAVILLDLKLPKVDGHEVLRKIRATDRTRILPVVIVTRSAEDRNPMEGSSLGCNSDVRKLVEFDTFVEATRQMGL